MRCNHSDRRRKSGKPLASRTFRTSPGCPAGRETQPGRLEPNQQHPREGPRTRTRCPGDCSPKKEPNTAGGLGTTPQSHTGPPDLQRSARPAAPESPTAALPQKAQQAGGSTPGTTPAQAQQGQHPYIHTPSGDRKKEQVDFLLFAESQAFHTCCPHAGFALGLFVSSWMFTLGWRAGVHAGVTITSRRDRKQIKLTVASALPTRFNLYAQ
ncbi:hypothetical protein NDU88_003830 [Pleurodeles waltl]|uniref:Uncharacterized protein n=1 Tax=Pleurodeles waltl TaxID=8319 RepID=A0AAV7UEE0_PLEWA|nr:hypothetical protein NDU88_003830 [Pleurodeles waltl]